MVGMSLRKYLPSATYISSSDYDLTKEEDVVLMYDVHKPDVVIHLAARVGGIVDNIRYPAEYYEQNVLMNTLVLKYAYKFNVQRFIGILSTCIYPDNITNYPIVEDVLHDGPPAITNFAYGYAKRSLAVQIEAYNTQYGTHYQYLTPCNLYGEYDKYGENSHFIAALIKKIHYAKINGETEITLMGDGTPLRQFMHSDDLAYVIDYCLRNDVFANMNVAVQDNLTIREMVEIAKRAMDAEHIEVKFDTTKPNGQLRKDVSIDLLLQNIPSFNPTKLFDGIQKTYNHLTKNKIL
jgi:GDP-L-fucose synthase